MIDKTVEDSADLVNCVHHGLSGEDVLRAANVFEIVQDVLLVHGVLVERLRRHLLLQVRVVRVPRRRRTPARL